MDPHTFCHYFMHFEFKLMQLCKMHGIYSLHYVKMCEYFEDVWILWKCENIVNLSEQVSGADGTASVRTTWQFLWIFPKRAGLQSSSAETWTGSHFKTPPSPIGPDKFQFNKQHFIASQTNTYFIGRTMRQAGKQTIFNRAVGSSELGAQN